MNIIPRLLDRFAPAPADLAVRRTSRFGRIEVTGLPPHLRGRLRREPDELDLAICAAVDLAVPAPARPTVTTSTSASHPIVW